jgi:hypothetical protein
MIAHTALNKSHNLIWMQMNIILEITMEFISYNKKEKEIMLIAIYDYLLIGLLLDYYIRN